MGGSANWIKSLINLKKKHDHGKGSGKFKKWKLWRSSSSGSSSPATANVEGNGQILQSAVSDSSSTVLPDYGSLTACKNVLMSLEELSAIRIQTNFRAFLARRALRALKALLRIQAIFRGRLVRKKAALTLKCMESLFRAQARVRAHQCSNHTSQESKSLSGQVYSTKRAEIGWCNSPGTAEEVKSKLQMRQEAALKRERAAAYALSQQQLTTKPSYRKTSKTFSANDPQKEEIHRLERWMGAKYRYNNVLNMTSSPISERYRHCYTPVRFSSSSYEEHESTKYTTKNNNLFTKISSRRRPLAEIDTTSSSELFHDESTNSNSSISTSETRGSNNTLGEGHGYNKPPSYMTTTTSQKAKQRASSSPSHCCVNNIQQQRSFDNVSFCYKSSPLSGNLHRRSTDLYPPVRKQHWTGMY